MTDKLALAYRRITELPILTALDGTEQALLYSPALRTPVLVNANADKLVAFRAVGIITTTQIAALTTTPVALYTCTLPDAASRAYVVTRCSLILNGPYTTAWTVPANCTYAVKITNGSGFAHTNSVDLTGFMDQTGQVDRVLTDSPDKGYGPQGASNPLVLHQNAGTALSGGTSELKYVINGYTFIKNPSS